MSQADPSFRKEFRKTVEQKLAVAATNNPRVIASWELSPRLDRVDVVCHENTFDERVIVHLESSLLRMLGVGKTLGAFDPQIETFTVNCVGARTSEILSRASDEVR